MRVYILHTKISSRYHSVLITIFCGWPVAILFKKPLHELLGRSKCRCPFVLLNFELCDMVADEVVETPYVVCKTTVLAVELISIEICILSSSEGMTCWGPFAATVTPLYELKMKEGWVYLSKVLFPYLCDVINNADSRNRYALPDEHEYCHPSHPGKVKMPCGGIRTHITLSCFNQDNLSWRNYPPSSSA